MSAAETRAQAAAQAFDGAAADYDRTWGLNPVGLRFRQLVHERLAALFASNDRVLDLGCGTGEDAVFLASRGVAIGAIDVSAAMIERTREKAAARGLEARLQLVHGSIEALSAFRPTWDGAYSNFGALNCVDTAAVAARLADLLRPGARVLLCVMPPCPLPAVVERALAGSGARRVDGDVSVNGRKVAVHYPRLFDLRASFGRAFLWTRAFALGVCVPGPSHGRWVSEHPLTFGALAMIERVVRGLPVLRGCGDHVVLEGVRV
jgi:SAM-dependent methyltransferase